MRTPSHPACFSPAPLPFRRIAAHLVFLALAGAASVQADGYTGNIQVRTLLRTDTTSIGQRIEYPKVGHAEVTGIEVVVPPGGETGWHRHPVPGYGLILEGVLTLESADGKVQTLSPGEAFAEMVGVRHNGRNLGTEPVRLVAFFTGEKGKPFTVRE